MRHIEVMKDLQKALERAIDETERQRPKAWIAHQGDRQVLTWEKPDGILTPLYDLPQLHLSNLVALNQDHVAWVDSVMDQAQIFASAWSLVGGQFDPGNALEDAVQAKNELRAMLTHPQPNQPLTDEQRDAARYRWLRSDDIEVAQGQREIYAVQDGLPNTDQKQQVLTESAMDEAIDTAMEAAQQKGNTHDNGVN